MAARLWAAAAAPAALNPPLLTLSSSSSPSSSRLRRSVLGGCLRSRAPRPADFVCRRAKNAAYDDYKFPDPIPEFAAQVSNSPSVDWSFLLAAQLADSSLFFLFFGVFQETSKFKEHMMWRLEQKKDDYFGEHVEEIVDVCTEASSWFPCA